MKDRKYTGRDTASLERGRHINTAITVGIILLMMIYLVMTIHSSARLAEQTDIISNHPFEVVISAGEVKLGISEMRIRTERLLYHRQNEDIEIVRRDLNIIYEKIGEPLAHMKRLYLGDREDVEALEDTLSLLEKEQAGFLEAIPNMSMDEEVEEYEEKHLRPLYDQAVGETEKIISVAKEKKVGYGETAETLRRNTLYGSIILMFLMIGSLLMSQYIVQKQREELAYRSRLFDNLSLSIDDTFIIQDARTREINYCALNMERVLGVSAVSAGEIYQGLRGEDAGDILDTIEKPDFASPFEKLAEYTRPAGEKRWLLIRVYRTEDIESARLITVFSDRTEEIISRRALKDAMMSAEKANMAKSDFLSRMSHEIRTPLNAIIGMTTIAAAAVKDPARVEDCLSKINFSSKHLLMLINDVLDMSKIESNKMIVQNEPFDIFQVINGFVSTVYAQTKAKQIEFVESMEGFKEHTVFIGDSLRLNQVLLNLSSNAVKFTAPGGRISLKVIRLISKSTVDVLRFVLSDTGIGMEKEAVERIFKPFEQADASISKRYGGTGLGMSITQNIVTLMNGKIRIESEPGVGTTFIVDLPFQRGAEDVQEPDFANMGLCALIVDDEQEICDQTSCLFDKIKIRSECTMSGLEAVKMVKEKHRENQDYDLCLVDWKMPDIDGIEVTRRIRREVDADIPIVMISAYDISEVEQEALDAGVNGFLPKPLYRSSVYAAIKEALEGKKYTPGETGGGSDKLAGMRLLVAEDNELNQEITVELLKMNGAEVDCANDGKEALQMFLDSEPGRYDAILMDVQMPVMDGHEAARNIRISSHSDARAIPIIAATANAFSDDITAALAAGMDAHVSKPLDIEQLLRVLKECISDLNR